MPEGPEVRRYADALAAVLDGERVLDIAARTRNAKMWLQEHREELIGRRIEAVRSRGKHLVIRFEEGYYAHSHLMMWGRWQILAKEMAEGGGPREPLKPDRRERARIEVANFYAILMSAPIFELGQGDPLEASANLAGLGPDALPYKEEPAFDKSEFLRRLQSPGHSERTIGSALLDQEIVCGLGNYLRAEILFVCRIDPWRLVRDLTASQLAKLAREVPRLTRQAYENGGVTVTAEAQQRMMSDESLVYQPGKEIGTRHWVFRRTNLPCLQCGNPVRQQRQMVWNDEEGERTRIVYFCPACQRTSVELPPVRKKARAAKATGGAKATGQAKTRELTS